MKVFLPSHGIFGQKVVNMKIPTFRHIHEMQSFNQDELLRKYKFVELLTNADFSKVTAMDVDYLFLIGAFSLVFNSAKFIIKCPKCGEKLVKWVKLTDQDPIELKVKYKDLPYHRRIKGVKYTYNILTGKQLLDAYEWAQFEEDSDKAFQDAQVAFIMGYSLKEVEKVRRLPISVYAAALLFQRVNYHGLDMRTSVECFKCHHVKKFNFSITTKILEYDVELMMHKFASVSDVLSFEGFMSMSVLDFNSFVTSLNNRVKK